MRWNIALLLTSIAVAASPVQAAKPVVPLAHVGHWEVNYDVDSCHLLGTFGSGDDKIIARFTRYQPGDAFSLTLIGKPMRSRSPSSQVKLDFGPLIDPQEYESFDGTVGQVPAAVFNGLTLIDKPKSTKSAKSTTLADALAALQTPGITPEQEALVGDLIIQTDNRKSYRLALGSMAAPMRTLRDCTTDLVRHWGLDPAEQASLTSTPTPIGEPGSWLRSNDYPAEMVGQLMGGLVQFRLDISETGLISGCHIQSRTNPDAFADLSCKLISGRGRFNPALDRNGKPVRSYYVGSARWQIGKMAPLQF